MQMEEFGANLVESCTILQKQAQQRLKKGECPTCGRKTHKISRFGTKREPLTCADEVINGHCLVCHPIEGYVKRPPEPTIPDTLEVPISRGSGGANVNGMGWTRSCDDDATVTSEITMDTQDFPGVYPLPTTQFASPVDSLLLSRSFNPRKERCSQPNNMNGSGKINSKPSATGPNLGPQCFEPVSEDSPMTQFRGKVQHHSKLERVNIDSQNGTHNQDMTTVKPAKQRKGNGFQGKSKEKIMEELHQSLQCYSLQDTTEPDDCKNQVDKYSRPYDPSRYDLRDDSEDESKIYPQHSVSPQGCRQSSDSSISVNESPNTNFHPMAKDFEISADSTTFNPLVKAALNNNRPKEFSASNLSINDPRISNFHPMAREFNLSIDSFDKDLQISMTSIDEYPNSTQFHPMSRELSISHTTMEDSEENVLHPNKDGQDGKEGCIESAEMKSRGLPQCSTPNDKGQEEHSSLKAIRQTISEGNCDGEFPGQLPFAQKKKSEKVNRVRSNQKTGRERRSEKKKSFSPHQSPKSSPKTKKRPIVLDKNKSQPKVVEDSTKYPAKRNSRQSNSRQLDSNGSSSSSDSSCDRNEQKGKANRRNSLVKSKSAMTRRDSLTDDSYNRFSLSRLDSDQTERRSKLATRRRELEKEVRRSKNMDSGEILRAAAAEAYGENLDDFIRGEDVDVGAAERKDKEGGERMRKQPSKRDPNRFSLSHLDSKSKKPTATRRRSVELETKLSVTLDSGDVLAAAAAEANGEDDVDAAVEKLFRATAPEKMVSASLQPKISTTAAESSDKSTECVKEHFKAACERETINDLQSLSRGKEADEELDEMIASLSVDKSQDEEATILSAIANRQGNEDMVASPGVNNHADNNWGDNKCNLASVKDIPVILRCAKLHPTAKCTERAFQTIFLLATEPDPEGYLARKEILRHDGMEALVSALWSHMDDDKVILALLQALWALTLIDEEDNDTIQTNVAKVEECGAFEALLFSIQQHPDNLSIQASGFNLIHRLSTLFPEESPEFKSATFLLCKNLWGIDPNSETFTLGLHALNSLCQVSDESKRELIRGGPECYGAVSRVLVSDTASLDVREQACQVFWCVTSDRTSVSMFSTGCTLAKLLIDALESLPRENSSIPFYEAAVGTFANLALDHANHVNMVDVGVITILCEGVGTYSSSEDVQLASCTALANISATREVRSTILDCDGVSALFSSMSFAPDNAEVQCEALRALNNLCEVSIDAKVDVSIFLDIIVTTSVHHSRQDQIQKLACSILSRLSSDVMGREAILNSLDTFDSLANIMKHNSSKKAIQKAACTFLCNLSSESLAIPILLRNDFVPLVLNAMDAFVTCVDLQESACSFLWNLAAFSAECAANICSEGGIHSLVNVMQVISTSASVQKLACGALGAIVESDEHEGTADSNVAIDALICLILVHPKDVGLLENAIRVLASMSKLKKMTSKIANAGGMNVVIETMRLNQSSTNLILSGSSFIQNMTLADPDNANEAIEGITSILQCLDQHPKCMKLVEGSCQALQCLVAQSQTCRDHIIAANGAAVIERIIDENKNVAPFTACTHLLLDELRQ